MSGNGSTTGGDLPGANVATDPTPPKWRIIGPGLVVAATGVGAVDLVATLIAGSKYGYTLLWCVVVGCVMKVVLVEGAGRWSLSTGKTIFEGWQSLGRWATWYFGIYIVIWGFVYGAAAMAGTGLPLGSLFPWLDVTWWGILSGVVGFLLVWFGRYAVVEKVCAALIGLMFVTMVGAAIMTLPNLGDMAGGLVPRIPSGGGIIYVLSLAGGVGGTITLAAYGYWLREKGWVTPRHMKVMRLDNRVAYTVTGIFVLATLVVGAELLYSANIAVSTGDEGLLDLSEVLEERYGRWAGKIFLVGFWAAAMSSLIGVWNGVSLMFADFFARVRHLPPGHKDGLAHGRFYRGYILWLTIPPMAMMFLGRPVVLILAYGVLGAFFMPFLAITLLYLLNSDRVPEEWRNKIWSNAAMGIIALAFIALAVNEVWNQVSQYV